MLGAAIVLLGEIIDAPQGDSDDEGTFLGARRSQTPAQRWLVRFEMRIRAERPTTVGTFGWELSLAQRTWAADENLFGLLISPALPFYSRQPIRAQGRCSFPAEMFRGCLNLTKKIPALGPKQNPTSSLSWL